ncbi:hypothetical protein [Glycomyces tenuis]|uniref:hypothetical protein n=1 Tax=Glycomyces tenuis TaxID=58116 RepID=UPI000478DFF3|nr:hypothetical protein [Glycomyces tenuis]
MSYPPPGGYDPQQYHVSGPPSQPSDPYSQGYNTPPPPPPGYNPGTGQYPNATPPIGVQPGYPSGPPGVPPSPLPPPIPPANNGSNLGIVLGVIVGLVVLLGIAAVLIVPGMLEDDDEGSNEAGDGTTSEPAEEESPSPETEESPSPEQSDDTGGEEETGGDSYDWGAAVNSDDYDPNTPQGVGISWEIAVDDGDMDALAALMCSNPSEDLQWDYEWEVENNTAANYDFLIWSVAKAEQNGEVEVWAGWTWDDTAPADQDDIDEGGGQYYTVVEEDGTWKVCDIAY